MKPRFASNGSATPTSTTPVALFGASHGQPNWAQTDFPSRKMPANFADATGMFCPLGFHCRGSTASPLTQHLAHATLLVILPPTGCYEAWKKRWRPQGAQARQGDAVDSSNKILRKK